MLRVSVNICGTNPQTILINVKNLDAVLKNCSNCTLLAKYLLNGAYGLQVNVKDINTQKHLNERLVRYISKQQLYFDRRTENPCLCMIQTS
jgi:hypothetical protein